MARSDNKRMKAFSKRLNEMRKETPAAVKKAEEDTAPKLSSVETPKQKIKADLGNVSFAEAFRAARKNNPGEPFTWRGKSYSTALASEKKAPQKRQGAGTPSGAGKTGATSTGLSTAGERSARQTYAGLVSKNIAARANAPKPAAGSSTPKEDTRKIARDRAAANQDPNFGRKLLAQRAAQDAAKPRFLPDGRLNPAAIRKDGTIDMSYKAKGGSVKKYKDGGPVMESKRKPIDMRRAILGSDKDIVDRANRTPREKMPKEGPKEMPYRRPKLKKAGEMGYKEGGKVMKKATKFGAAMKNKSADAKGRAMTKMACGGKMEGYAKGGSIDGIAMKGKTRCKGAK